MPTIKVNDITMYYEIHGAGEPLVLISGLNSDHTLYRGMVPQLAEKYQVIFDGGHIFFIFEQKPFLEAVLSFLASVQ